MIKLAVIALCLLPISIARATVFLDHATYFANLPTGQCFYVSGVKYMKIEDDWDHSFHALNTSTWAVDRNVIADTIVRVCKR